MDVFFSPQSVSAQLHIWQYIKQLSQQEVLRSSVSQLHQSIAKARKQDRTSLWGFAFDGIYVG